MSKIIAKYNISNQEWTVDFQKIAPTYANVFIGFVSNDSIVEFKDLKFKYELKQNNNIKQYGVYPQAGIKYVKSDQDYIVVEQLNLEPETNYELYFWAENDEKSFEKTFSFTTPTTIQPYPSWIWNEESWIPPVQYPDDDNVYIWDETNLQWKQI